MKCTKQIQTDWHNAKCENFTNRVTNRVTKIKPFKRQKLRVTQHCRMRQCKCRCECECKCMPNELVLSYVFKQQIYYVRCVDDMSLNWVPLIVSNGTGFINLVNQTQMSSVIQTNSVNLLPMQAAPVVFPDYSKVDVGKGIQWPAKVFAPYVDSTAWPTFPLVENFTATGVRFYNLGFIVSKSSTICEPNWGGYYGAEAGPLNAAIKALRGLGGDVTVSFGGAANTPLHITAPDVDSLKEQYKRFVIAYGLTRIDFDLEGGWIARAYEQNNINNSMALKILQDELMAMGRTIDIWFTLPILPTGLTADGVHIIQLALNANVTIKGVNAMTMDYGPGPAPEPAGKMGQYGIQAITSLKNQLNTLYKGTKTEAQLWAMIGTTPMIGKNDVQAEIFMQSDARQTLQFAQMNSIGMISMWSANRDNSAMSGIPQTNNEFQQIFNPYNLTLGIGVKTLDNPQKQVQSLRKGNKILKKATHLVPMQAAPVVYPDYSKVDVGQGIQWPAKVFTPYVDSTACPPFPLVDNFIATGVPFYNLGFIVSRTPTVCEPSWGTYYGVADGPLNAGIKRLRELGGDVTVSFGGAASVPLHITTPDVDSLKEQYKRFVIAYGLTRIDFDLERTWVDRAYEQNNINNSMALKILQDELMAMGKTIDIWFTLPILPTGLTDDGVHIIQLALNAGVTIKGVNAMTMDYGDVTAPDPQGKMGQYGIQAITSLKNQLNTLYKGTKTEAELWAMIGMTPMIGRNDVQTEIFMQSDATQTLQFAQMNNIGTISMWSANRDNSAASRIPQTDNKFQKIFNAYNSTLGAGIETLNDPQKQIQYLKEENKILKQKQIQYLKLENKILKKAMHLFTKD